MTFCVLGWKGPSCLHVELKAPYGKVFPSGRKNVLPTPLGMGECIRTNSTIKACRSRRLTAAVGGLFWIFITPYTI